MWRPSGGGIQNGHIRYPSYGGTQKKEVRPVNNHYVIEHVDKNLVWLLRAYVFPIGSLFYKQLVPAKMVFQNNYSLCDWFLIASVCACACVCACVCVCVCVCCMSVCVCLSVYVCVHEHVCVYNT